MLPEDTSDQSAEANKPRERARLGVVDADRCVDRERIVELLLPWVEISLWEASCSREGAVTIVASLPETSRSWEAASTIETSLLEMFRKVASAIETSLLDVF